MKIIQIKDKHNLQSVVLLMLLIMPFSVFAQKQQNKLKSETSNTLPIEKQFNLSLFGFKKDNKVYLRWRLANAKQWRMANKNGYILERAEAGTNQFKKLTISPIKYLGVKEVVKLNRNSDLFKILGIVYQQPDYRNPKISAQDEQLYGAYFFLSSYNTKNAILTGSAWVDSTIQEGKAYDYRIAVADVPLVNQEPSKISINKAETLMPVTPILNGEQIRKSVKLTWNNKDILNDYFAIYIEKSTDSIHFTSMTQLPYLTSLSNAELKNDSNRYIVNFNDTSVKVDSTYFYRLRGLNVFGIKSQPSNVFTCKIAMNLVELPKIILVDSLKGKNVIRWELSKSQNALVKKYQILYSPNGEPKSYQSIKEIKGGGDMVASLDMVSGNSQYFRVKAIGFKRNEEVTSLPYLYQLTDSIPPAIPTGLNGTINKKGVVQMHWNKNDEKDFKGYRLYKRLNGSTEFAAMNATPIVDTVFTDTLPLNQLHLVSMYCISSLDNRYNESKQSSFIQLKVPDTIPPAPPRILEAKTDSLGVVHINWILSFSKDVKNYLVFRKELKDTSTKWIKYAERTNVETSFIDKEVRKNTSYYYKILAVDSSDLISSSEDSIKVFIAGDSKLALHPINKLSVYITKEYKYIELSWWANNVEDVVEYQIYRASNKTKGAARLLANLPIGTKRFVDEDISPRTTYTYYVKAIYRSGKSSAFEKIEAAY